MNWLQMRWEEYMASIGTSTEFAIILLVMILAFIISTRDTRIGLLFAFIMFAVEFIVMRAIGYDTLYPVAGLLLTFGLLTLTLLVEKSNQVGVY